jgi:uncharacterized protein
MTGACPICKKPRVEQYRPFCSKRCADVDLNRWMSGAYAVPGLSVDEDEDGRADLGADSASAGRQWTFD